MKIVLGLHVCKRRQNDSSHNYRLNTAFDILRSIVCITHLWNYNNPCIMPSIVETLFVVGMKRLVNIWPFFNAFDPIWTCSPACPYFHYSRTLTHRSLRPMWGCCWWIVINQTYRSRAGLAIHILHALCNGKIIRSN